MDEAAKCDRIALMHKGRILHTSKPIAVPDLFKDTLIEILCDEPVRASRLLRESGAFGTVQGFGDRIHVSGPGAGEPLAATIRRVLSAKGLRVHRVVPIEPGIEDVFVELLAR